MNRTIANVAGGSLQVSTITDNIVDVAKETIVTSAIDPTSYIILKKC